MVRILMVCLGNICRSPLAHGILESKLNPNHFFVDSAGTAAYHVGNLPDIRSIATAKKYGLDITNQRARKFSQADFDEFDYIYAMDDSNYQNIIRLARNEKDKNKVHMILNETLPESNASVPDPYYGGDQGFEDVFHMLEEACTMITQKLQE